MLRIIEAMPQTNESKTKTLKPGLRAEQAGRHAKERMHVEFVQEFVQKAKSMDLTLICFQDVPDGQPMWTCGSAVFSTRMRISNTRSRMMMSVEASILPPRPPAWTASMCETN
jgi:hypothetical protein